MKAHLPGVVCHGRKPCSAFHEISTESPVLLSPLHISRCTQWIGVEVFEAVAGLDTLMRWNAQVLTNTSIPPILATVAPSVLHAVMSADHFRERNTLLLWSKCTLLAVPYVAAGRTWWQCCAHTCRALCVHALIHSPQGSPGGAILCTAYGSHAE